MAKDEELKKFERRVRDERRRIDTLLVDVDISEKKRDLLVPVIKNVAWMYCKLEDTRALIETAEVVTEYDNGGGQKGTRENPLFKAYENLWKSYLAGWKEIRACLPDEKVASSAHDQQMAPANMLELIRNRRKEA